MKIGLSKYSNKLEFDFEDNSCRSFISVNGKYLKYSIFREPYEYYFL